MCDPSIEQTLGVTFADPREHALLDWDRARRIAWEWCDTAIEVERCVGAIRAFVLGQPAGLPDDPKQLRLPTLEPITERPDIAAAERIAEELRQ